MKNYKKFLFLALLLASVFSFAQKKKELNETILKIVEAYKSKDEKTMNSFINKDWGLTFVFQRGVFTTFSTESRFSFAKPVPEYLPYQFEMKPTKQIKLNKKINFSCETEKWNASQGIYYLPVNEQYNIARTNKSLKKIAGEEFGIDNKLAEEITQNSIVVIAVGESQDAFIFYLTPKNGKWYLTAIDRFEVCGA